MKHIYLIRHGESAQNVGQFDDKVFDPIVPLTERGLEQGRQTGIFLTNYCYQNARNLGRAVIYHSTYLRAEQTATQANKSLQICKVIEEPSLREQEFGNFDCPLETWESINPHSFRNNQIMYHDPRMRFFAKMDNGESGANVYDRTKTFVEQLFREENEEEVFIFAHGTVIKTLLMNLCHKSVLWFGEEPTPENCSIREIEVSETSRCIDHGYLKVKTK